MPHLEFFGSLPGLFLAKLVTVALWLVFLALAFRTGKKRYILLGVISLASLSIIFDMLALPRPYRLAPDSDRMNQLSWTVSLMNGHPPMRFPLSPPDLVDNNPPFVWAILAFVGKLTGLSHLLLVSYAPLLTTVLLPLSYYFFGFRRIPLNPPLKKGETEDGAPFKKGETETRPPSEKGETETRPPSEKGKTEARPPLKKGETDTSPLSGKRTTDTNTPLKKGETDANPPVEKGNTANDKWVEDEHRWAGLLMGLSILFLTQNVGERPEIQWSFWNIQVLLKPDHALAYSLLPLFFYSYLTRKTSFVFRFLIPGLLLGLLISAFIPLGAYVVLGMVFFVLINHFCKKKPVEVTKPGIVLVIAVAGSSWYWLPILRENIGVLWHLTGAFDYFTSSAGKYYGFEYVGNPFEPYLFTPFLIAFAALGLVKMLRRFSPTDRMLLAFSLAVTLGRILLPFTWVTINFKPLAYQTPQLFKLALGIAAGVGMLFLIEIVYANWQRIAGYLSAPRFFQTRLAGDRGPAYLTVTLLLLLTPFFTPVWRLAPQDDAWRLSREPIPEEIRAYAGWVSKNTDRDAVFLADRQTGYWINSLTGRLMVTLGREVYKPQTLARHRDAAQFYATEDATAARKILEKYNVAYVVVSPEITEYYGEVDLSKFENEELFESVFADGEFLIYRVKR